MGFFDAVGHLVNFMAPALGVALLTFLASRLIWKGLRRSGAAWLQLTLNFLACLAVLSLGLWYYGQDGRMATYAALVLASATVQWLYLLRAKG